MEPSISSLNAYCDTKGYPHSIDDKGWLSGVWYCSTYRKGTLYGQYPSSFLPRVLALFPDLDETRLLHCPSGIVTGPGMTVDIKSHAPGCPSILASVDALPFKDGSFDLYLADPPYSDKDSKKYGTKHFPFMKFRDEAFRVVSSGGYLGLLHLYVPPINRRYWRTRGIFAVVTGPNKRVRAFTLLRRV